MSPEPNGNSGRPTRKEPSLNPPKYLLNRHGGRVLDPSSAVRSANQPAVRPTVYVGGQQVSYNGHQYTETWTRSGR